MGTGTEPSPGTTPGKKARKKGSSKSVTDWLSPKRVQQALPLLQLGLGLLEGNKAARPYVHTLRTALNLGDVVASGTEAQMLAKMRETRIAIKELKKSKPLDKEKLKQLRAQLDQYIDLALNVP